MIERKILVPLDGSVLGEAVLDRAVELAREGATLVLLRAAQARHLVTDAVAAQLEVVREAETYLTRVTERLRQQGVSRVESCVWYGPAAEAIVEGARARKAELILMSSHGRSGFSRLVLGSVAETVLRGTSTPIMLIRPTGAPVATIPPTGARPAEMSGV